MWKKELSYSHVFIGTIYLLLLLSFLWVVIIFNVWSLIQKDQDRWKVIQKYSYFPHWIRDGQKP